MDIGSLESCPPKVRILLWADLHYSDAEEITKTESIPDISRILCQALHIEAPDPQQGIVLELYTNTVLFCRQKKFNKEQTSVLLSIIKNVHQLNTETPLNNMDQCFTYCSELVLCHSVRRPPFSIDLFNSEQVTEIMKYFINTYMRHYLLYKSTWIYLCLILECLRSSLQNNYKPLKQRMKLKMKQSERTSKKWLLQKSCPQRQRHLNKIYPQRES
ncbi:coiled-coil domain-containing protein 189 isoform X2 [Ictalurus punctatus]|uniref:Coiled-coil domain-containing protein 189 isoform X2 n=1 Tax=Ictalurus punctatus TaxID=7998 RepID=A0A979F5Y7_ICTPU|nr:coiled-coil domain-containing protein 189 isoform X2 [Ictalurus punctatus]